jgi:acetyl-CoA carboxylase biotin carboxyl carrier protein
MSLSKINVKDWKRRFTKMSTEIKAPLTGKIVSIVVNLGDQVKADDEIVIMDAMKMEIPVYAPADGTVKEIKIKEGDSVKIDQVLMILG